MPTIASGWKLDVERGPDWLLVKVKDLNSQASGRVTLADNLWEMLQRHFTYRLVLEMDQVSVLDSHLIGQLMRLYKRIRRHSGVMRLCGLSPYNLHVLETCRLNDRLVTFHNREEAVMGRCHSPQPK